MGKMVEGLVLPRDCVPGVITSSGHPQTRVPQTCREAWFCIFHRTQPKK